MGALDPPQRRQRTLDALKRLLLRESQVQPLLLVVRGPPLDRLRDPGAARRLVESLPAAPAAAARELPAGVPARAGAARPTTRSSGWTPCRRRAPRRCWRRCSGADAASSPSSGSLIARTEGNPFFLEESVRTLVETGALVGRARRLPAGAARCRRIQVPATVQAVLAARIDRLPPEDKRSSRPPR